MIFQILVTALLVGAAATFVVPPILEFVKPHLPAVLVRNRIASIILVGLAFMIALFLVREVSRAFRVKGAI